MILNKFIRSLPIGCESLRQRSEYGKPFLNFLVPLFQNESSCKTFFMKLSLICRKMNQFAKNIFIWMVSHEDSFWYRGNNQPGNGLLFFSLHSIMKRLYIGSKGTINRVLDRQVVANTLLWYIFQVWPIFTSLSQFSRCEFQILLLKTIWRHWNCFLSPVATVGMDGDGLKLEKIGQFFQVLILRVPKIPKNLLWLALSDKIHLISSS